MKKYKNQQKPNRFLIFFLYFPVLIFFSLLFLGLTGCKKEVFEFDKYAKNQNEAEWCFPAVHGQLRMADIINDSLHTTSNEEGLISMIYHGEVSSQTILDNLEIPEIENSDDFHFDMPEYVPLGDSVYVPYAQFVAFNLLPDQKIKTIRFSSCHLLLTFYCDLNKDASVWISIPGALKNGEPYSTTLFYHYDGDVTNTIQKEIDLSGYQVYFLSFEGSDNLLKINCKIYVISNSEPNNSPYLFQFTEHLSDISIAEFTGYAGNIPFPVYTDTISIDLFKNRIGGTIQFNNPIIRILAKNSIGAPIGVTFEAIKALFNNPLQDAVCIEGAGLPNPWFIQYPQSEGGSATSGLELNADNSNVREVANMAPDQLVVAVSGTLNPEGIEIYNFINAQSILTLTTDVELPLYGKASDLSMEDNYDFNFDKLMDLKNVEFKINFTNSFAVDMNVQVYFTDSQKNILDSLFANSQLIEHGEFDPQTLRVVHPFVSNLTSVFENEKLEGIKYETARIMVKAGLDTPDNIPIKIFSDNFLGFSIGIKYSK